MHQLFRCDVGLLSHVRSDLEPLMHKWLVHHPLLVLTMGCQLEHFRGVFVSSTACSVELRISLPVPQRLHILIEMLSEEIDFGVHAQSLPMK